MLYKTQGQYAKAEPLYRRALAILEKALGPEHPIVATSLNSLAELYRDQSQYAKAEPLYQRALAIREKALGPEHPDVAMSLNNLAGLYDETQGQYAEAEPLHVRALAILEKALDPDTPTWRLAWKATRSRYETWAVWRKPSRSKLARGQFGLRERLIRNPGAEPGR